MEYEIRENYPCICFFISLLQLLLVACWNSSCFIQCSPEIHMDTQPAAPPAAACRQPHHQQGEGLDAGQLGHGHFQGEHYRSLQPEEDRPLSRWCRPSRRRPVLRRHTVCAGLRVLAAAGQPPPAAVRGIVRRLAVHGVHKQAIGDVAAGD